MQRVNEFVFYDLALTIRALAEIPDVPYLYSANWLDLWKYRVAVNQIYIDRALHFTAPAASRLYAAMTAIVSDDFQQIMEKWKENTDGDADVIPSFKVSELKASAKEFETALRTECQLMDTYFVEKKGTNSTKDLIENAHRQIPEPGRSELPAQVKLDFDQAGRCFAFDVPTAAAFHLLRATESVLRDYYYLIVPGTKQAKPKMRNWGAYIKLLKDHGGDANTLNLLEHMRDAYRNPVTHPEENYSDEKVQVLFGLCVSAITLLLKGIRAGKNQSGSLPFSLAGPSLNLP